MEVSDISEDDVLDAEDGWVKFEDHGNSIMLCPMGRGARTELWNKVKTRMRDPSMTAVGETSFINE